MVSYLKENSVIALAFSIPVIFIAIVAISIYWSSWFLSTNYNFVYATCGSTPSQYYYYPCRGYIANTYTVLEGRLESRVLYPDQDLNRNNTPDIEEGILVRFFIHDTDKNESREITESEAMNLNLNSLLTSPDGVSVSGIQERGADFLLFFSGNSSFAYYLTKGSAKTRLNLIGFDQNYYYNNDRIEFIGWVLPGR